MRGVFLGTGTSQGVPVITCKCDVCNSLDFRDKRTRTAFYLEVDGVNLVIDTGPDFRQQMLRERVERVDAVLFTHEHKDHVAGLDDVRAFNFAHKMDMPLYAEDRVLAQLRNEFFYAFGEKKYPGVPQLEQKEVIENESFIINGLEVHPIRLLHYKLPIFGYKIKGFAYLTDVSHIPESEKYKLQNLDSLVLTALRREEHLAHFTLDQALKVIEELKPKKAYLTHASHLLGKHNDVQNELPENVYMAYDGLEITI